MKAVVGFSSALTLASQHLTQFQSDSSDTKAFKASSRKPLCVKTEGRLSITQMTCKFILKHFSRSGQKQKGEQERERKNFAGIILSISFLSNLIGFLQLYMPKRISISVHAWECSFRRVNVKIESEIEVEIESEISK